MTGKRARRGRSVNVLRAAAEFDRHPDGVIYVRSRHGLPAYPAKITACLEHWAATAPDRTFLAERGASGDWVRITYADTLRRVRAVAQALVMRKLNGPVAILSGNGIDHALLGLACMYVGTIYAPISPAYSLVSAELSTLRYLLHRLRPALVYANDACKFQRALALASACGAQVMTGALAEQPPEPAVDDAHRLVGPDTVAKVLFTSGSTGRPKGVITTNRMLCSNQEMLRTVLAFLAEEPPVLCDWLPWNHVFGGSHNFGIVLYNGGTLFIDEGKPTPTGFAATLRNLREVASTAFFNVPRAYELLVPALRADPAFARHFFSRVKIIFYAAAGLNQRVWDDLRDIAVAACGEEILMVTGLGATESSPFALCTGPDGAAAGRVGLPVPGVELKLVPLGEKIEARLRGPNITPGFWQDDELTRAAFDDEGFYRLGDALLPADPDDPQKGFVFDGRITEDFKLSTGTWVSVGPLRERFLTWCRGAAVDVVLAAPDRAFVTALIFPAPGVGAMELRPMLESFAQRATGASTCIQRALVLDEPPSIDAGELTDKSAINQKAVLRNRASLVEELYMGSPRVIDVEVENTGGSEK
ncbi:MAG: lcfB 2 [Bryobacterales bacterium]|nr:lcfB 2 [Bryobacterales bacterium]